MKTTEYVSKEEHDASIIGEGMLLSDQFFNMDSGEEITAAADESAGEVEAEELVAAVKEITEGSVGKGENIVDISFEDKNLLVVVDLSGADTSIVAKEDIAEIRISSITDDILSLEDKYYNTWDTVTIDFGPEGKVVLDKSMVVDQGLGRFFDFPSGILK